MPLRAYEPIDSPCRICGRGFDLMQSASEPPLRECPKCGLQVRIRTTSEFATPKITRKPSVSEAKQAGFTVLKRTDGGEYEKQ